MTATQILDSPVRRAYDLSWKASLTVNSIQLLTKTYAVFNAKINIATNVLLTGFNCLMRYRHVTECPFPREVKAKAVSAIAAEALMIGVFSLAATQSETGAEMLATAGWIWSASKALIN